MEELLLTEANLSQQSIIRGVRYCLSATGDQTGTGLLQVEASLTKKRDTSLWCFAAEGIKRSRKHGFFGKNQEMFIEI